MVKCSTHKPKELSLDLLRPHKVRRGVCMCLVIRRQAAFQGVVGQ